MKKILLAATLIIILNACELIVGDRVEGNGNTKTELRNITSANKIKTAGSFDIEIAQGNSTSVTVEADENLLPYIETFNEDGWLIIRPKEHAHLSSKKHLKVSIVTNKLEACKVSGSGNVVGKSRFTGGSSLDLGIAGSGDITLEVNTPTINGSIAGSGNITLVGETKETVIKIAGNGDWRAENLKAENADVHIAGSGNVHVFADNKLSIHIAGSGDVFYKGNPQIDQHIAGSGNIKKLP
jgi:hypothetical protein